MNSPYKMPKLNGAIRPLVSEADPDFDTKADPDTKLAVSAAIAGASVEPATGKFETPQEETRRRLVSLKRERKIDDQELVKINGVTLAKYKIEITFAFARKLHGDNACLVQFWESGKKFHGGGDQLLHVCRTPNPDPSKQEGCGGFISGDDIIGGVAFCRNCLRNVNASMLSNEYLIVKRSTRYIAEKIAEFYRQLGSNADIYLKFHKTDIRYIAMEQHKGPQVAEKLKGMHIYPLHRIIQDTSNGADLVRRFHAFLTA